MSDVILQVKVTIKSSDEYVIRKRQEDNQVIQQDEVVWLDVSTYFVPFLLVEKEFIVWIIGSDSVSCNLFLIP